MNARDALHFLGLAHSRSLMLPVMLLFAITAQAQSPLTLEAGFERDVNRYRWVGDLELAQPIGGWDFAVSNRFTSDAFMLFGDRLSFRDENQLRWLANRPLGSRFALRMRGTAGWYTQSRVFSQQMYGGLRYAPRGDLWVEPALGLAWDRRPGVAVGTAPEPPLRMDAGPAYAVRMAYEPPPLQGYDLRFDGRGTWQAISPRSGREVRLAGSAARSFEDVRLTTQAGYSNYRRDAYQAVSFLNRGIPTLRQSETVEATTSDTLIVRIAVEAPIYRRLQLIGDVGLAANRRLIRTLGAPDESLFFDTNFSRRAFDAEVGVGYEAPQVVLSLTASGGAEIEDRQLTNREDLPPAQAIQKSNLLSQADYDEGRFALHARGRLSAGRATFAFDGTSSILRHDTPENNLDDRDEVYHTFEIDGRYRASRYLEARIAAFASYYHTVYLHATRSAENNIQRSIRLRPALQWTPSPRTMLRLGPEIRATYTVDDFVLPGRRSADQSAREVRYDAALEQQLVEGLRLLGTGSMSDLRLGRLIWDRFAEIPFDTLQTYSGWVRIEAGTDVVAEVGLRFFIRTSFDRSTTVRYRQVDEEGRALHDDDGAPLYSSITRPGREWIEQVGPTCSIMWPMQHGSTLRLDGWVNVQRVRFDLYGELPDMAAPRIRREARRGDRKIIPNVSLTVRWNL